MAGETKADKGPASDKPSTTAQPAADLSTGPQLDREIQAQIGDKLRTLYGDLSGQPVPDRLVALIESLNNRAG